MLLGIEAGIPDELYEKFNLTGTSHVIVISGSNVALVTGVLMALGIRLFGKRGALWPTLGRPYPIHVPCGAEDAAVMRAALMGGPVCGSNGAGAPEHRAGKPGRGLLGDDAVESAHAVGCWLSTQQRSHCRTDYDRTALRTASRHYGTSWRRGLLRRGGAPGQFPGGFSHTQVIW